MLDLGVRLWAEDIDGAFRREAEGAARLGFCCAEVMLGNFDAAALTEGLGFYIKRVLRENGLDAAAISCGRDFASPDPMERRGVKDVYRGLMRVARAAGAGVVTVPPHKRSTLEILREETIRDYIRALEELTESAEEMGAAVAIVPEAGSAVFSAERAKRVLSELRSASLRVMLDPAALITAENFERRDKVVSDALESLSEHIAALRLRDVALRDGRPEKCAVGEGTMDYRPIARFISERKPHVQIIAESAGKSRDALEKILSGA